MDIQVNGIRVHFDVHGPDGAPWLLCLHSLATDLSVWDGVLPALATRRRVLRVDLRGHGGSSSSPPPYGLGDLVADAVATLDALDIARADVMGLSVGGMIAMGLSIDHPERVERLVVMDVRADAPPPFVAMWDAAIARALAEGLEPVVETSLERWFSTSFRERHHDAVAALRDRAVRTSIDGFVGCARAVQGVALRDALDRITSPTAFVVGEVDQAAPPDVMADMAARVVGAELIVIPGAAHLTPVEAPDDVVVAVTDLLVRPAVTR